MAQKGRDARKASFFRGANDERKDGPGGRHHAAIQAAMAQGGYAEENLDDVDDLQMALIGVFLTMAANGDVDGMTRLITKKGVSPEAADYDGRTALHCAAATGAFDAVKFLVDTHRVNVNPVDRFHFHPLDDALNGDTPQHLECAKFLREHNATSGQKLQMAQRLRELAAAGELGPARTILESVSKEEQADLVNSTDYDERTALHVAVQSKNLAMVQLLMEFGANMHKADRFGLTPFDYAKRGAPRIGVDPVFDFLILKLSPAERERAELHETKGGISFFTASFLFFETAIILLHGFFVDYGPYLMSGYHGGEDLTHFYPIYQDVHVMIFIGFAYLMTFLRKNAYQSIGMTFFLSAFCIQWYCLVGRFFENWIAYDAFNTLLIDVHMLVRADFCAGAVMITYGVVLGKMSPFQLIILAFIEVVFYSINEAIGIWLKISDVGGTMTIHLFGAVFGLALSFFQMRSKADRLCAYNNENNSATYHSDVFAMFGTVFLWLYWPTFNSFLVEGDQQGRAIINTLLSLTGSCVCAFTFSHILRKERRFSMVDAQNATLAGGVAMGAAADMYLYPGTAMAVGAIAGTISVFGFVVVAPILEKIGVHDTCGVNNLHGMPSFFGACVAMIAANEAHVVDYGAYGLHLNFRGRCTDATPDGATINSCDQGWSSSYQAGMQVAYTFITIAMGLAGAIFCAIIVFHRGFDNNFRHPADMFRDDLYWETPSQETPYFFDYRGEVKRKEDSVAVAVRTESEDLAKQRDRIVFLETALKALESKTKSSPQNAPALVRFGSSGGGSNVENELGVLRTMMQKILAKLDR